MMNLKKNSSRKEQHWKLNIGSCMNHYIRRHSLLIARLLFEMLVDNIIISCGTVIAGCFKFCIKLNIFVSVIVGCFKLHAVVPYL